MIVFATVLSILLPKVNTARILAIAPLPSYSHQVVYHPIWRELSLRGHQVTLITTDPLKDPTLTNLTEIDTSYVAYKLWNEVHNITDLINKNGGSPMLTYAAIMTILSDIIDKTFDVDSIKRIVNLTDEKEWFDLVMVEVFHPAMFAMKRKFDCPLIALTSLEALAEGHKAMGNPVHPILYPEVMYPFTGELSFFERCLAVSLYFLMSYYEYFVIIPREDETVAKHFGPGYPSLVEIRNEVDLLLVNANPVLQPARPTVPGTIYIGGGIHISNPKPLSHNKEIFTF